MKKSLALLSICIATASATEAQSMSPEVIALHRAVFDRSASGDLPDGEKTEGLAHLYANGNGVRRDPIMACTLFDLAERARMNEPRGFEGLRLQQRAEQLKAQYCDLLTPTERQWAFRSLGCAVFGLPRGTLVDLGPGWWLEFVNADTVSIDFDGKEHEQSLAGAGFLCPSSHVVLFRHTVLAGSARADGSRHFLEIATWRPGCCNAIGTRAFTWRAYEVRRGDLGIVAQEQMVEPGSIWPAPSTKDAEGARFTPLESGAVEYEITLDVPRRGRIAAPGS